MIEKKDIFQEFSELDDFTQPKEPEKFTITPETLNPESEIEETLSTPEDKMELTQKISTFEDQKLNQTIEILEVKPKEQKNKKKELTSLEASFVNCSILGFITLFIGFGWAFNLFNQIAL